MSRAERRAMVTSSADGFRDYLGLSSNELRSAASLNSHWLRTLRPRNLKPAAATLAPPFCPPQHMRHCVESAGEPGDTILA